MMTRPTEIGQTAYARWIADVEQTGTGDPAGFEGRSPPVSTISVLVRGSARPGEAEVTFASLRSQTLRAHEIIVCTSEPGRRPSRASPSLRTALEAAAGAFVTIMDLGDQLSTEAFERLATALSDDPDADGAYSDEDEFDPKRGRARPYFKGEWSPDLFLSQGHAGRLCLWRTDRARSVVAASGIKSLRAMDDIILAGMAAGERPLRIRHVPQVLYHRRAGRPPDTAPVTIFSRRPDRLPDAKVALQDVGFRRIVWPAPSPPQEVTIVIPTKDRLELLERTITSLKRDTAGIAWRTVVVDNGSAEKRTLRFLEKLVADPRFSVERDDGDFNFSRLVNRGVGAATAGDYVCLLNNDIEAITPNWLAEMVRTCQRDDVGIVGSLLLYEEGTIQHAGCVLFGGVPQHLYKRLPPDTLGHGNRLKHAQDYVAVTAACMVVKRSAWDAVGGFDEALPVSYNDIDFCLRVRAAGWRVVWTPHARLFHLESASRGSDKSGASSGRLQQDKDYIVQKFPNIRDPDPFYSPHLSLKALDARINLPAKK